MEEKAIKTKRPKKIIVGKIYMIMYVGWKKIKVLAIGDKVCTVQEPEGKGIPFAVATDSIKINLIK